MNDSKTILDGVAVALEYPTPDTANTIAHAAKPLDEGDEMRRPLLNLAGWLNVSARGKAEEWYSQIFDLSPVCTLNLGFHLFGEQYERGAFLAGLVAECRAAGVPLGTDLPDYLPTILRLLARIEDRADAQILCGHAVLPALTRMNEALVDSKAPWAKVLAALPALLEERLEAVCIPKEQFPSREQKFLGKRLAITDSGLNRRRNKERTGRAARG